MSENGTDIQLANFEEKCLNLLQNCTLTDVGLRRPVFRLLFDSVLPENVFELNLLPKNLKTDDSDSTCELQAGISTNCSEKEFNSVRQCYSEIDTFEVLRSEDVCITNVDGFCEVSFQNFLLSKTPLFYNYNFRPFYFHMRLKQQSDMVVEVQPRGVQVQFLLLWCNQFSQHLLTLLLLAGSLRKSQDLNDAQR